MKFRNKYYILSILFALPFYQNGMAQLMPLDSILKIVEINNPELDVYEARINAYKEYAKGANSIDPPQAGAGFFMTPYNVKMWNGDEMTGADGMGSFMISAQQMIMNKQKRTANADYMNSMSAVDSSMKNAMRNEMFAMVKMSYYEWMIMKKKQIILSESEELIQYLIQSTELKYTYGMDKLNAYYKAKAMLGEIQTMKLMVEQDIARQKILLNTLMNRDKNFQFDIDTSYSLKNYEKTVTDSSILFLRSDYQSFSNEIKLLQAKSDYEYSLRLPDYGFRYDHMFPFGNSPQQFSLMFMVTIPIAPWSSGMYSANIKGLKYEMEALKEKQKSLVNNISGEIEITRIRIANKKQQLKLTEEVIIPSMKNNYDTELLAYEQNDEMLFMVLDAWQNLKTAKLTALDQIMEILSLQTNYEKLLEIK